MTASSSAKSRGYTYDENGNRKTTSGTTSSTENVSPTNNFLNSTTGGVVRSYSPSAVGSVLSDGTNTFTYNNRGRMASVANSSGTTNYVYNALGQLIEKSGNGGTTLFMYDEAGHIIAEYSSNGALIQETIWMGDTPVATLYASTTSPPYVLYYAHADHLNTPRKVTRPVDNALMWRWDPDTFGSAAPQTTAFIYNLRFPGMYALPESGLYNNYFRDYDPIA